MLLDRFRLQHLSALRHALLSSRRTCRFSLKLARDAGSWWEIPCDSGRFVSIWIRECNSHNDSAMARPVVFEQIMFSTNYSPASEIYHVCIFIFLIARESVSAHINASETFLWSPLIFVLSLLMRASCSMFLRRVLQQRFECALIRAFISIHWRK